MEYEKIAHMIVFGETFSGKTYYTKHILNVLDPPPEKIYVFTGSPHEWDDPKYKVYKDNFDENAKAVVTECSVVMDEYRKNPNFESYCPHVVIFDDFNEEINTKTNETYKSLYTRGRHYGIRVINLAHQSKAIGPLARANARYIFILSSTSEAELENLSELFYGRSHLHLKKIVSEAYTANKYNCVVLDKRTKKYAVDKAPAVSKITRCVDSDSETDIEIDVQLPQNAALMNPVNATYYGVGNPYPQGLQNHGPQNSGSQITNHIGGKTAHNMYDNSTNNFNVNHNIKMNQLVETNNTHNEIKLQNLKFEAKLKLREDVFIVGEIINKPFKTLAEKEKLIKTMNRTLRPEPPFTIMDYEEGIPIFMKTYFGQKYEPDTKHKMIESAGSMIMSGNDPIGLMSSGWGFLSAVSGFKF
jgi:hypothetical protein